MHLKHQHTLFDYYGALCIRYGDGVGNTVENSPGWSRKKGCKMVVEWCGMGPCVKGPLQLHSLHIITQHKKITIL